MNDSFLDRIIYETRERVSEQGRSTDADSLRSRAIRARALRPARGLKEAIAATGRTNIVAEIKRASPSKGIINNNIDVAATAKMYEQSGAAAISVLTEEKYFKGSIKDLKTAHDSVELPILRKDFIIDEYQILEAAAAGADAILLIVAALTPAELRDFSKQARELGMDALVEVHTLAELQIAAEIGADLIGVNNRDLRTFNVSLDVSRELIRHRPPESLMVTESGLTLREEIEEMKSLGFNGFLVGESLMRDTSSRKLRDMVG